MSTKHVRVVPSFAIAGLSLSGEIAQAFERIRERAYTLYDSRAVDQAGSEFEDWLRAERELFEVPDVKIEDDADTCRLRLYAESLAERPITVIVEPSLATVLGHRRADGEMVLFRLINLPEPVDPLRAQVVEAYGDSIEIVLTRPGAPEVETQSLKAMAAAAGREVLLVG
jgi:hypothetical protein